MVPDSNYPPDCFGETGYKVGVRGYNSGGYRELFLRKGSKLGIAYKYGGGSSYGGISSAGYEYGVCYYLGRLLARKFIKNGQRVIVIKTTKSTPFCLNHWKQEQSATSNFTGGFYHEAERLTGDTLRIPDGCIKHKIVGARGPYAKNGEAYTKEFGHLVLYYTGGLPDDKAAAIVNLVRSFGEL
jgi:hypothetical protein